METEVTENIRAAERQWRFGSRVNVSSPGKSDVSLLIPDGFSLHFNNLSL